MTIWNITLNRIPMIAFEQSRLNASFSRRIIRDFQSKEFKPTSFSWWFV